MLMLTASAKIISIIQSKPFLNYPDPVFTHLSPTLVTKQALEIAALAEICVGSIMFIKRKSLFAPLARFLLVSCFVCYRMLATVFAYTRPCSCLGRVLDWTGFNPIVLDDIPIAILWFMGIGSCFFLIAACILDKSQNKIKVHSSSDKDNIQSALP